MVRLLITDGKLKKVLYEPGDHAVVFPPNVQEDVDFLLDRLNKLPSDPDSVIQLHEYDQQEGMQFVN